MAPEIEDLDNKAKFRQIAATPYDDLITFIFKHLKRSSVLIILYWSICVIFLLAAAWIRINIAGYFSPLEILSHSLFGFIILPVVFIPVHELLHIIPYWISGARNIRVGMDLKQFLFYVTAHRHVASATQFVIVALVPFILISSAALILILFMPGIWKWSFSIFLFAHSTMCAGDFALLNFYWLNRDKEIYTWDDADEKIAYFYEKI